MSLDDGTLGLVMGDDGVPWIRRVLLHPNTQALTMLSLDGQTSFLCYFPATLLAQRLMNECRGGAEGRGCQHLVHMFDSSERTQGTQGAADTKSVLCDRIAIMRDRINRARQHAGERWS